MTDTRIAAIWLLLAATLTLPACGRDEDRSAKPPPPIAAPAAPTPCTFQLPQAPEPPPANFDWRPLAQDWCDQLAACGFSLSDCVDRFVAIAQNPAAGSAAAAPSSAEESATVELASEDSEEYHAGTVSCGVEMQQQRAADRPG